MSLPSDQVTRPGLPTDPTAPWPIQPPPAATAPWPSQAPPAPPVAGDPRYGAQPPYGGVPYGGVPWGSPPPPAGPPPRRRGSGPLVAVVVVIVLLVGALAAVGGRLVGATTDALAPRSAGPSAPASPLPTVPAPGSSGRPSAHGGVSWATVAAAVSPGVVNIETRVSAGVGAGTGMILTADGRVLTNNHVIDGASQIAVTTVADGKTYRATVVGTDPDEDVAVLQLTNASGLTTIPLGNSDDVAVGDEVAAIGNAGGQGGDPAVAPGPVTALDQEITATDQRGGNPETLTGLIQVAADVVPGDSGGPLADANGKVVGMDTAASAGQGRYRTVVNQGYAIPINHALDVAKQLVAHPNGAAGGNGTSNGDTNGNGGATGSAGHLGVAVQPGPTGGAQIVEVEPGSAADDAGLEPGDVITAVDGTAVRSPTDLTAALKGHAAGSPVTLTWTGTDGRHRAAVTLG